MKKTNLEVLKNHIAEKIYFKKFSCLSGVYKTLDLKNFTHTSMVETLKHIEDNTTYDLLEEAYYDLVEDTFGAQFDSYEDEDLFLETFAFDHIYNEDLQAGDERWVRIWNKSGKGFVIRHGVVYRVSSNSLFAQENKLRERLNLVRTKIMSVKSPELDILSSSDLEKSHKSFQNYGDELNHIEKQLKIIQFTRMLGIQPIYVKVQLTKSKFDILHIKDVQFCEVNEDIEKRIKHSKNSNIKIKTIYKSDTADQVFYLRSRGISKESAEILSNLNGTSIHYNVDGLFKQFDQILKEDNKIRH